MKQILQIIIAFLVFNIIFQEQSFAQPVLKPFIGLSAIPNDADPVCTIPLAIDPGYFFVLPGLQEGDTIPDFKLYTLENDSMHIGELLADGKPVLLVGGNFTCPKYRNHMDELNDLQAIYGTQVHIFVVYTVEAHPADPDISPYNGEVWELNSNINLGISYHQPTTYLERKDVAEDMFSVMDIQVPVLIDGPCNEWWQTFALAPNPSFLISPNGTIFKKQGWFDNGLYAVSDAIDSLLENFPTAIPEVKSDFKVINDPASSFVQFVFSEEQRNVQLMLFDVAGKIVKTSSAFSGNTLLLEKQSFVSGLYLYSAHTGKQVFNGKIMIQ